MADSATSEYLAPTDTQDASEQHKQPKKKFDFVRSFQELLGSKKAPNIEPHEGTQVVQENPKAERNLTKVGHQLGSNEGGWYQDEATGERLYVKFYKNPDQGKMELIANRTYEALGIAAPHTELLTVEGRTAVGSREISDHHRVSAAAMAASEDVQNGFVADAFLANWDVVGLVFDNIEEAEDGRMYRIDNGGVLTFRAQGGPKAYPGNTIGELETLRDPNMNPQSVQVFGELSEAQMIKQARHLVATLTDEKIQAIVSEGQLSPGVQTAIIQSMQGRRDYLVNRFHLNGEENAGDTVAVTEQKPVSPEDYAPFPEASVKDIFEMPNRQTYSTIVFESRSNSGDTLLPTQRMIYAIPEAYRERVIRDIVLKHRKDPSHSPGKGWDPEGAYSQVLVRTKKGEWRSWIDPKGYDSNKFAEPRSAADPEVEVLHDWIATVGEVRPTVISVENVGHGDTAISEIHGLEVIFFPETKDVSYNEKIFSPGTAFIDLDKGIRLPTYGGGKKFGGTYPDAVALSSYGSQDSKLSADPKEPMYMDSQGRLHIKLEPGKKFVGLEVAAGDTHPDGRINKQGGTGTLGWAKLYAGFRPHNSQEVQYFMRNVNVPPAGVLTGSPETIDTVIAEGDEIVLESRSDITYVMGFRVAYKD